MNEVLERVEQLEIHNNVYKSELLTLFITLAYSSDTEELNRKRVDLNKRSVLEAVVESLIKNLSINFASEFKKEHFVSQTYLKVAKELYNIEAENSEENYINDLVSGFTTLLAIEKKVVAEKDSPIFCKYSYIEDNFADKLVDKSLDLIAAHRKLNKIIALDKFSHG